jgi:hypothetical protein
MKFKIYILLFILILWGCEENNSTSEVSVKSSLDDTVSIYSDCKILKLKNKSQINIRLGSESKDIYLLFTNPYSTNQTIKLNSKNNNLQNKIESPIEDIVSSIQHAPKYIMDFNHKIVKKSKKNSYQKEKSIQSEGVFYLKKDTSVSTKATERKYLKNIKTEYGNRALSIWVSDDSFGENCSKLYCIEQNMIDELANSFLRDGDDNDIYDWVSNIFGAEWGETKNSALIKNKREITILLTDIDNDNKSGGGVLGYFYAKDNYRKEIFSGSNERTMFYIDSVVFARHKQGQEWSIDELIQKKMLSTLAHEFEHMIQFYQKNILYSNSGLKPWIDEMLAVTVEDIIATKLKSNGIRGVSYTRGDAGEEQNIKGKFSLFNQNINLSLPTWNNKKEDYSKVGAFGSYLIRNYGGAKVLHDTLHSKYTDEEAILNAIHKSPNGYDKNFNMLMHDWGIAVLLSSNTNLGVDSGYLYNLGDFLTTEYRNSTYDMGSINFFNYKTQPNISDKIKNIAPKSNLYYKVGNNLTGDVNITIEKSENILTTLIVK